MLKPEWWLLTTCVTVLISIGLTYISATSKERRMDTKRTDESHANRIGALETKVTVLENTAVTEEKVRLIIHEQLQPLVSAVNTLQSTQTEIQKVLIRMESKLPDISQPL